MSGILETEVQSSCGVRVNASLAGKLNLADHENAVPALRELTVSNEGDKTLERLVVSVSSDPPFFKPRQWHIDAVRPRQTCRIRNLDLPLDGALLSRLTESTLARVTFEVRLASGDGAPLSASEYDVELLPRNHWGGLSHLPEMVAAFAQPNDPAVERILKKSAQLLRDSGQDPALTGYHAGPKHAWEILSAIWSAIADEELDYALPPASFEQTGQKVRGPSQVVNSGLGTCLDFALLFAAAAEQAGLNPLVVFTSGHAFTGCWLRPEEFTVSVVDDSSALRKRLLLQELILFETTVVTERPAPKFSRAVELGAQHLAEDAEAKFEAAIDIRRARRQKIRPLASAEAIAANPAESPAILNPPTVAIEEAPDLPDYAPGSQPEPDPRGLGPSGRVARWQRKLLDLSLRNSLLNFRKNKRAMTFDAPDPGKLEDALASGQPLRLLSNPALMDGRDPRSRSIHEGRAHEDVRKEHALEALGRREVFAAGPDQTELESTLVELYRSARASLAESGANTLFLALGFLVWTQEGKEQKYRAPLILVPVTLNRKSVRSGFTLSLHEEEPQFNPTLVEMLKHDFQLDIGIAEGDLPKDDAGLDVKGIWAQVSQAIKDIAGWEVATDVVLSTFSFAKHLMWKDLVQRTDQLRQNPVVRHLIDTPRENYASDVGFVDPRTLDKEHHPRETFCPLPADSSQLAAIMSAARGKDFVLIGPPGTGKSQTIANLIAQCIASGKRVLFVAEKIAALEVVYRRLYQVGLGQFCLQIHSAKAKKSSVLGELGAAWDARGSADAQEWEQKAQRLKSLRDTLNAYVERLHQTRPNGMTVHRALGNSIAGHGVPIIDFPWPDPSGHDRSTLECFRNAIAGLQLHAEAFGVEELKRTPLMPVGQIQWTPLWQTEFLRTVRNAESAAMKVQDSFRKLMEITRLPESSLTVSERVAVVDLVSVLPECIGRNWAFAARAGVHSVLAELRSATVLVQEHRSVSAKINQPWPVRVSEACRDGLHLLQERQRLRAALPAPWPITITGQLARGVQLLQQIREAEGKLSVSYNSGAAGSDFVALVRQWESAEQSFWPISWLAKRRIKSALAVLAGGAEPDAANDLPILSQLEKMRSEVNYMDLGVLPPEVWSGLRTGIAAAEATLRLQTGIAALHDGRNWQADGVELVASGLCGSALKQALDIVLRLIAIDDELSRMEWLNAATSGVWAGAASKQDALVAAIDFCEEWGRGSMQGPHDAVAGGDCGEYLKAQHGLLMERARIEAQIAECEYLQGKTDGLWAGLKTDLVDLQNAIEFAKVVDRTVPAIAQTPEDTSVALVAVERLCRSGNGADEVREAGKVFSAATGELWIAVGRMADSGLFAPQRRAEFESLGIRELQSRCEAIVVAAPKLQKWCSWSQAWDQARVSGLGGFVSELENGTLAPADLQTAFYTNYSRWWLDHTVSGDEVLRTFASVQHERRIAEFQSLDDQYTKLTSESIRAQLYANTPSAGTVPAGSSSEWSILRHELNKKKKHLPLRELMHRIPSVVATLTPCLLMSPLSIAQYLAVSSATFDVVVFDEASQITVWDAIGAIARARQVVMVGDPKQLPPTNFFNKADSEEEPDDFPEDLESILDECIGANLPNVQLSWHYRSRHESLIAFSNRRYYGGGLVTFPSPVTDDRAVSFHYVRGVYEKGGARTNPKEAKALVRDIVERLRSPEFAESGHSIGVVTFNAEQQKLIEDLLDDERRKDPSIEPHFAEDQLEPVFVKNLESVQGDERDLMYFSITYGPDIAGRVSMNFGPMNRDGGERRLNVAITRARHELRVFSSLRAEQFDLTRTQAGGVADLKYFLEYAERGSRAFAEHVLGSVGGFESPFEEYVAKALQSRGWTIHTQIGASAFRIDLGVVHPDAPGIYLAGVECDGATYHRSATARDRDKLRQQVLCDLGWKIARVWSTDWWLDRESTLDTLDAKLNSILEESRRKRAAAPNQPITSDPDLSETIPESEENRGVEGMTIVPVGSGEYRHNQAQPPSLEPMPSEPLGDDAQFDTSRFFERSYDSELSTMIAGIVETEGPILDEALARRIARLHGWQRTGARITERVTLLAGRNFEKTKEDVGKFFWPRSLEAGQLVRFRPGMDRSIDEICIQELVSLATHTLEKGRAGEEAIIAMAKAVGLQRLRVPSRRRLEVALARAQTMRNV